MDQATLAASSNLSRNTIIDFENGRRTPGANNVAAIRSALETAGIQFIAAGDTAIGSGVALK